MDSAVYKRLRISAAVGRDLVIEGCCDIFTLSDGDGSRPDE